jgi:hypothetical protein
MRFRSLVFVAVGVGIGMWASRKLREDDPLVVSGPTAARPVRNPALRIVSVGAQAITDRATVASLDAIRKARGAIRQRLGAQSYDDIAWN